MVSGGIGFEFTTRPDYLNGPEFEQLFNLAKYTNMNKEERSLYNRRLKYKWENANVMDYAVKTAKREGMEQGLQQGLQEGMQQGIAQGLQQGLNEGLQKKAVEMARQMLLGGEPLDKIERYTGLSIPEIKAL